MNSSNVARGKVSRDRTIQIMARGAILLENLCVAKRTMDPYLSERRGFLEP
jgi:hypothetical protein